MYVVNLYAIAYVLFVAGFSGLAIVGLIFLIKYLVARAKEKKASKKEKANSARGNSKMIVTKVKGRYRVHFEPVATRRKRT